nr:uncharacterized protein LOC111425544 [Onthophagus taurus]
MARKLRLRNSNYSTTNHVDSENSSSSDSTLEDSTDNFYPPQLGAFYAHPFGMQHTLNSPHFDSDGTEFYSNQTHQVDQMALELETDEDKLETNNSLYSTKQNLNSHENFQERFGGFNYATPSSQAISTHTFINQGFNSSLQNFLSNQQESNSNQKFDFNQQKFSLTQEISTSNQQGSILYQQKLEDGIEIETDEHKLVIKNNFYENPNVMQQNLNSVHFNIGEINGELLEVMSQKDVDDPEIDIDKIFEEENITSSENRFRRKLILKMLKTLKEMDIKSNKTISKENNLIPQSSSSSTEVVDASINANNISMCTSTTGAIPKQTKSVEKRCHKKSKNEQTSHDASETNLGYCTPLIDTINKAFETLMMLEASPNQQAVVVQKKPKRPKDLKKNKSSNKSNKDADGESSEVKQSGCLGPLRVTVPKTTYIQLRKRLDKEPLYQVTFGHVMINIYYDEELGKIKQYYKQYLNRILPKEIDVSKDEIEKSNNPRR